MKVAAQDFFFLGGREDIRKLRETLRRCVVYRLFVTTIVVSSMFMLSE